MFRYITPALTTTFAAGRAIAPPPSLQAWCPDHCRLGDAHSSIVRWISSCCRSLKMVVGVS